MSDQRQVTPGESLQHPQNVRDELPPFQNKFHQLLCNDCQCDEVHDELSDPVMPPPPPATGPAICKCIYSLTESPDVKHVE